jgi:outer membrane protein
MKAIKYVLLIASVILSAGINAQQVFVGGNISFSTSGGSNKVGSTTTDKPSSTDFSFSPKIGAFVSEKFAVGMDFDFTTSKDVFPGTPETVNKAHSFGIGPFIRYYAVSFGKFSVFGQAQAGIDLSSSKSTTGGTTNDGPKVTSLGIAIFPGLAYDLNEKISLETSINLLSIAYGYSTSKQDIGGTENVSKTSGFSFGAGTDNIVNTGAITVGAIIRF